MLMSSVMLGAGFLHRSPELPWHLVGDCFLPSRPNVQSDIAETVVCTIKQHSRSFYSFSVRCTRWRSQLRCTSHIAQQVAYATA